MSTNKIILKTTEEVMSAYKPIYRPIYPLLMSKAKQHPAEVGKVDFKAVSVVGDIRAKRITPKDTEIKQIAVGDGKKSFAKYFHANQFTVSNLQDKGGQEDVNTQVLDEHNKQADELVLLGGGTSVETVVNNGLYWSADANYVLETSKEIAKGTANDHLKDLYTQMLVTANKADEVAGQKLMLVYGSDLTGKIGSLFANTDAPFNEVLQKGLPSDWSLARLPSAVTPSGANGWIAINMDQIALHYTKLPGLEAQGVNEEKMYAWFNYLLGSFMVEVLTAQGIIRQPVTFQAL